MGKAGINAGFKDVLIKQGGNDKVNVICRCNDNVLKE